jgi:hypothetical protein
MIRRLLAVFGASLFAPALWAADALTGEVHKQPLNVSAIVMFVVFVGATLCITYWASKRNKSAADYYAAGGKITGFQNGLAIAGDYMSAASFLGISALVFTSGYDGLIGAVASFDPARGVKFETFCRQRILGAIRDWQREIDPLGRSGRNFERSVTIAEEQFQSQRGRAPSIGRLSD